MSGVTRVGEGQPRPLHLARQFLDGRTSPGENLHGRLVDRPEHERQLQGVTRTEDPAEGRRFPIEEIDEGTRALRHMGGRQLEARPAEDDVGADGDPDGIGLDRIPARPPGRPVGVDHLGRRHIGSSVPDPARHAVLVECHQCGVPEAEESQLVPIRPDQQVDTGCGAIGHRGQRVVGQQDTVDDRKERKRHHARIRTALPELFGGGHKLGRGDVLEQLPGAGRDAQDRRQSLGRPFRVVQRVHMHTPALHDGAPEEAFGGRRPEQRRHAEPSCGLPEDGDGARIAAKGRDVVAHPSQGTQLIL